MYDNEFHPGWREALWLSLLLAAVAVGFALLPFRGDPAAGALADDSTPAPAAIAAER